jgi:WD40 repeat protein
MTLKWSPNGTQIASGSPDGTVRIWDALTGALTNAIQFSQSSGGLRAILDIDWSPDSTLIAGARETGSVIIWDVRTGERRTSYSHDSMALTVAWNPSNDIVASGGLDGKMLLWDANNHNLREFAAISSSDFGPVDSVAWDTNGERIAISTRRGGIQVFNFFTQTLDFQISQPPRNIVSVSWSPDGRELAVADSETITIVDASTELIIDRISGDGRLDALTWSPYGGQLAFRNSTSQPMTSISRLDGAVQIVVPAPSLERLQAIADACNAPVAVEQSLTASLQADQLGNFITQVEALSESTIPPACAADLIAVAEALQNQ